MGDMNNRNISEMKAYSKIEVQMDMLALYQNAYDETETYLQGFRDDDVGVAFSDIPEPASTSTTYHETIANSLIDSFKEGTTTWDEFAWSELDSFKATLVETIEEEKQQVK